MNLFFDTEPIQDTGSAIAKYGKREFQSPTRSTIPLLSLLKDDEIKFNKLLNQLGVSENSNIHLEYKVPPKHEKGRASQTDVMVISGNKAVAIEVKWTESRYQVVDKWLHSGKSIESYANRINVLSAWIEMINLKCKKKICINDVLDIPYQMIHRAASACKTGNNPMLVYLQFIDKINEDKQPKGNVEKDLTRFWNIIGKPANFPFHFITIQIEPKPDYIKIKDCSKGSYETAKKVVKALNSDTLFSFLKPQIIDIQ